MGQPAARVGDPTAHGTPAAPGPGQPTVLIEGKPAWRAGVDTHVCPVPIAPPAPAPHGPEKALPNASFVMIGGAMASRMGDQLLGVGPPSAFTMGATKTFIGNLFGMMMPHIRELFCKEMAALMQKWDSLTPNERLAEIKRITNLTLRKSGSPGVETVTSFPGQPHELGSFSWFNNTLKINQHVVNAPASAINATGLANTIFHEARHAQQFAMVGQFLASQGLSPLQMAAVTGSQTAATYGRAFPLNQAQTVTGARMAARNPWPSNSSQAHLAGRVNDSVFGPGAAQRINALKSGSYRDYRDLAEEKDAFLVGNSLPCGDYV